LGGGGLDLKPTRLVNEALMLQLAWKLVSEDSQWTILLCSRYFSNGRPIQDYFKSSIWCGIKPHIATVIANSLWVVGTGEKIHFWIDNWLGEPLVDILHIDPLVYINFTGLVSDVISNGALSVPFEVNLISTVVSMCSLCLQAIETSDHLFFQCIVATSLWSWLGNSLPLVFDVSSFYALLHSLPISCSSQLKDIYLAVVVHLIHSIWWARNNSRFSSNRVSLQAIQVWVHSLIGMSGGLSTGKCIVADSSILDFFKIATHSRLIKDVVSVCWKAPTAPWVKVNTHGSVIYNLGVTPSLII